MKKLLNSFFEITLKNLHPTFSPLQTCSLCDCTARTTLATGLLFWTLESVCALCYHDQWQIQTFLARASHHLVDPDIRLEGKFSMFPSISRISLRWRGQKSISMGAISHLTSATDRDRFSGALINLLIGVRGGVVVCVLDCQSSNP